MKSKLMAAIAALTMAFTLFSPYAEAKSFGSRGGGGGRSSSFGGSKSSSPKPSAPAPSKPSNSGGWGSSSSKSAPSNVKPMSGSSGKASGYTKPNSKIEYSRHKDAVKSGKAFTTKESATADFKAKHGNEFSTKFKSEPATRPAYIPSRYRSGGRDYDISYNPSFGGYGYWNGGGPGLGTFLLYDAISDTANAALIASAMNNKGYYIGPKPPNPYGWILPTVISVILVGGVIWFVFAIARD